ncbi:MAG: hypothetical protein H0T73_10665 [Ardenticatenales bacterium]|nr:hypothetical protein [Ardenticatenales bacterium]
MNLIPNTALAEPLLPPPYADWDTISEFALTVDGYRQWGTVATLGEMAAQSEAMFREHAALSATLTELRGCLFFEQRRWRHYGEVPDREGMRYIHTLVEAIRHKVRTVCENVDESNI